jgi:cell division protein FtsW (lipid II flippase)
LFSTPKVSNSDLIQGRLLILAGVILGLYSLAFTLSPAARMRSWDVDYHWEHWLSYLIWVGLFTIAHHQTVRRNPHRDPYLLPLAGLLTGLGLLTIWRLDLNFGLRQTLWLLIALLIFIFGLRLAKDLNYLRRYKYIWLSFGLIITALTLFLGTNPLGYGPRLWLGCCGIYFQPSEPLKLLLVIYLAAYLADWGTYLNLAKTKSSGLGSVSLLPLLAPTLIMTGMALLLLVAQRDLGTAFIFLILYATIVYIATGNRRILLVSAISILGAAIVGYTLFDLVQQRVNAWINPWLDPSGGSYQIVQSLFAIANGGLPGRGPGMGYPNLIPISHSDFIYSAIVEEGGLLFAVGLLIILALLVNRGLLTALRAPDTFRRLLAAGLTTLLVAQSILIIGGNIRLLPLTGVTLPFVSYGGSSLLTSFIALLILMQISSGYEPKIGTPPSTRPYRNLGTWLFTGIALAALLTGWWAVIRAEDLLARPDNARRSISDLFVQRGAILESDDTPLAATRGRTGDYSRIYQYIELGPVIGYAHPVYGLYGLEESFDPYLRGLKGNPNLLIWWNYLLYGSPPPGLDVKLSLDLNLQRVADDLMGDNKGGVVLLNAQSGEFLVMASHPTFDANDLTHTWSTLIQDDDAPLLNRTTLGLYPTGAVNGPFLLTAAIETENLPPIPDELSYTLDGEDEICTLPPTEFTWGGIITAGCPGAVASLGAALGDVELLNLYERLGYFHPPQLRLPTTSSTSPDSIFNPELAALGIIGSVTDPKEILKVSPLQMAIAAATLSFEGSIPAPHLGIGVDTTQAGWAILPPLDDPKPVYTHSAVQVAAEALGHEALPVWESLARAPNVPDNYITWYIAGTLPDWGGAPLSIALTIEDDNPLLAQQIGRDIIIAALQP